MALDPELQVVAKFGGGGEKEHFDNFVNAVRSRKHTDLHADIEEGHQSAALCHLANISLRLGDQKSLAELKEIAGSKDATAALTRMLDHLKANGVDADKTLCHVGPLLAIDPTTERFIGKNDKANQMLSREYRKGFEIKESV